MFFVALGILIFQYFKGSIVKSFFISLVAIPLIFMIAYNSSSIFNQRVDKAISGITGYAEHLDNDGRSSIGIRLLYAENTLRIIKDHPFIGVGTGDFPSEYERVNMLYHPQVNMLTVHPHNMYLLVFAQLGILGLISLLSIFYYQIKIALSSTTQFSRNFGIALPLMFLVIMWSDAYLLGHFTTTLFVFMSSFLYKTYEEA
jgi:O-antigen ligase